MVSRKLMGIYMGFLILGVILYGRKELNKQKIILMPSIKPPYKLSWAYGGPSRGGGYAIWHHQAIKSYLLLVYLVHGSLTYTLASVHFYVRIHNIMATFIANVNLVIHRKLDNRNRHLNSLAL